MRCKACDKLFDPSTSLVEDVTIEEECCYLCIGAAFDMTYEPQGIPRNQEFIRFLEYFENKA
jgi:hypothetical protein